MKDLATVLLLLGGLWFASGGLYRWSIRFTDKWGASRPGPPRGNAYGIAVRFMAPVFFYGGAGLLALGLLLLGLTYLVH